MHQNRDVPVILAWEHYTHVATHRLDYHAHCFMPSLSPLHHYLKVPLYSALFPCPYTCDQVPCS
jgi:hypothetical protein